MEPTTAKVIDIDVQFVVPIDVHFCVCIHFVPMDARKYTCNQNNIVRANVVSS